MLKKVSVVIALAAIVVSGTANAQGAAAAKAGTRAAEEVSGALKGGTRETIRPGTGAGGKVGTSGVVAEKSNAAAGTSSQVKAQAATGVDSHVSCPANSVLSKLSRADQEVVFAASGKGAAGSACLVNFESVEAAQVVAAADAAAVQEMDKQGVDHIKSASFNQKLEVLKSMTKAVAAKMSISLAQAKEKIEGLCKNGCDVASADLCAIAAK